MTEQLAWVVFGVGAAATAINLSITWIEQRQLLVTLLLATLLTGVGLTVTLDPERVQAFTEVFAAAGIIFTALKYASDRHDDERRRLATSQAQHNDRLIADWQAFVSNEKYVQAIYLLETRAPSLQQLNGTIGFDDYKRWKNPLDQVFDFLQRLAYAVKCRNLEASAVREAVGWYYRRICELDHVREYCETNGYETIPEFFRVHMKAKLT